MTENVYAVINSVTLNGYNEDNYELHHIVSFDEYDYEIIVESASHIDGLKRGWTGDLFYHANGFSTINDKKVTSVSCVRDVLLARVTASAAPQSAVTWKYTFLKD